MKNTVIRPATSHDLYPPCESHEHDKYGDCLLPDVDGFILSDLYDAEWRKRGFEGEPSWSTP